MMRVFGLRGIALAGLAAIVMAAAPAEASQNNWFIFGQGGIFDRAEGDRADRSRASSRTSFEDRRRLRANRQPGSRELASVNRQQRVSRPMTPAPQYRRQTVDYAGPHAPGTIIVDTQQRFLFHVQEGGKATRYGVGVGKAGFDWSGTARIGRKAEWPSWRPPAAMIAREKAKGRILPTYMPGGPENPLGARALYLFQGGNDTLYRIHGTNAPWSIGQAMSSGCIRMMNEDVTHLYENVKLGAKVVVL